MGARVQRTPNREIPMPYNTWVFMGKLSPRIPREHNEYHGYTVRGTPNCPLKQKPAQTNPMSLRSYPCTLGTYPQTRLTNMRDI